MEKREIARKNNKYLIGLFVAVFLISLVNSVSIIDDYSVNHEYEPNEKLRATITLKLTNESSESELKATFLNASSKSFIKNESMKLIDFLKAQNNINYSCSPANCNNDYTLQGSAQNSINVLFSDKYITGFRVDGNDVLISDFSLRISSDAANSCSNQISIDVNDDNEINFENNKYLIQQCGGDRVSTCYSSNSYTSWFAIVQEPYCEKIRIDKSPAIEVNAYMKANSGASYTSDLLKASLYDEDKEFVGDCNFPKPLVNGSEESCIIKYNSKKSQDAYICVGLKEGSNTQGYSIQARATGNKCGFQGDPSQSDEFTADYNIKVAHLNYDSVGTILINSSSFQEQNDKTLVSYLNEYITTRYNGDCPDTGCIIPILISGKPQQLTIDNLLVKYSFKGSGGVETSSLYRLTKSPSKISSGFINVDLAKSEFTVPSGIDDYNLSLALGTKTIFNEEISVNPPSPLKVQQVYPRTIAAANPTEFEAFLGKNINLTQSQITFEWNFGDNSSVQKTTTNLAQHTYNTLGTYTLSVKTIDKGKEIGTSSFIIFVESPKNAINSTIEEYELRIDKLKQQTAALPLNYQNSIKESGVDIAALEFKLGGIEDDYTAVLKNNGKDSEYIDIMNSLHEEIDIPLAIQPSQITLIPFAFEINDVNIEDIGNLFGEVYLSSKEDEYKNKIALWFLNNINAEINHKVYTIFYENFEEDVFTEFSIKFTPKKAMEGEGYLVIERNKDEIFFTKEYDLREEVGVTGVLLDLSKTNDVTFALPGKVDIFDVPIYLSPEFKELSISEPSIINTEGSFLSRFVLGVIAVLILTLLIYILLQEWYKHQYENYLFKNKNTLYNLLYFIHNARAKNMSDEEIKSHLKKAKWDSEQISYALKKFEGKRIGMWEIPVLRVFEKKKMDKEIMRRSQARL